MVKSFHVVLLIFVIAGIGILPDNASGQSYTIKQYTTQNGIPHNNIRAICRDTTGYLWLGTWDGLSRFDGYEFRNYRHHINDSNSIPFFSVFDIECDRFNNVWVLTDDRKVTLYNRSSDDFSVIGRIGGRNIGVAFGIDLDEEGNLVIVCADGFYYESGGNKSFSYNSFIYEDGRTYRFLQSVIYLSSVNSAKDDLWISGYSKISRFRKSSDSTYVFVSEFLIPRDKLDKEIDFDYKEWFDPYCSENGNVWLFSNTGLFLMEKNDSVLTEYRSTIPTGELKGRDYFFWGHKEEGLYIYSTASGDILKIPGEAAPYPVAVFPEGESVWFSHTTSSGVAQGLSHLIMIPHIFTNTLIKDDNMAQAAVYALAEDNKQGIWAGIRGKNGILVFNPDQTTDIIGRLNNELVSLSGHIRSLKHTEKGMWIGYYTKMLRFYDYKTKKISDYTSDIYGFRAISLLKDGKILVGTDDLTLFDPAEGSTETLWNGKSEPATIFRLLNLGDSIFYGARAQSSLLRYNYYTREGKLISIPGGVVNAEDIIEGTNGEFWIAMLGDGVCRYDPADGSFRFFTTAQGLSNNTTYCLLRDKKGNIWVSTNEGISRINSVTGKIRAFGYNEGLRISEFNSGAKLICSNGDFLMGGMGGFARFNPDSVADDSYQNHKTRIFLTNLSVSGNKKILSEAPDDAGIIVLNKGENNFNLSFSSTDFINSDKILYRYRLEEIDRQWTEVTGKSRIINYSNLIPGSYNLDIEATDPEGNWAISRKVKIELKPFIYQTKGFRLGLILLAVSAISAFIYFHIKIIRQKGQIKIDNLRLQSLRGQMNPHFIFNSLNSINYFISNNDKISANRYISDFSRLIRSIINNLGYNYVKFEVELQSVMDYLKIEHLRFGDKFNYEVITKSREVLVGYEISPGIIQPLVENAIWHGVRPLENRMGHIKVAIDVDEADNVICIVEDNGIGVEESMMRKDKFSDHKSKGMGLVKERLEIYGKLNKVRYKLETEPLYPHRKEKGTRVLIEIPNRKR